MSLNDVWRNINQEIGIFWKGRWDEVPSGPGVYAWFYPLRISTYDLRVFLDDVSRVMSFDARSNGVPSRALKARMTWEEIAIQLRIQPSPGKIPVDVEAVWSQVTADPLGFERLRRAVMRGSLFMPPLYVGKASSLSVRCHQHLAGSSNNDFHKRYRDFARTMALRASEVNDLLFACIRTASDSALAAGSEDEDDAIEGVVEEILKRACRPRYSVK
jgi:hypothetical protein